MRTRLSLLFIFFFGMVVSGYAAPVDLEFKQTTVDNEFAKVDRLEKFLAEHPEATLETVKKEHPELLAGYELVTTTETNLLTAQEMPIVGGFWWGCCLGIVGLGLVYFITDNDHDEVRKALWGCVISTIFWGVGGLWDPFGWF